MLWSRMTIGLGLDSWSQIRMESDIAEIVVAGYGLMQICSLAVTPVMACSLSVVYMVTFCPPIGGVWSVSSQSESACVASKSVYLHSQKDTLAIQIPEFLERQC